MSEAKIPAGWYPDPKDTTTVPRPERWWDGTGWTAQTRPAQGADLADTAVLHSTKVIQGELVDESAVRYPEMPTEPAGAEPGPPQGPEGPGAAEYPYGAPLPPKKPSLLTKLRKPVVVAAAVAGVLGLAIGSGVTLAVDHHDRNDRAVGAKGFLGPHKRGNANGNGNTNGNGNGGSSDGNGQPGTGGGNGNGNGFPNIPGLPGLPGGGKNAKTAIDLADGVSLPIPSGWQGGTANDGTAYLTIGSYQCPGGTGNSNATCSLGGVNTVQVDGRDVQAAAKADVVKAAEESYPNSKSHQELKSEAVTVAGRSGYLVRWDVTASQGNNGTVESVVFPTADGKGLVAVRLGFDQTDKAPAVSQMDTIVSGIKDFTGKRLGSGGGTGGTGGTGGSGSSTGGDGTNT
ncbi:DUF2510 domain-containing protein [Streptomyces tateyamensis]|uniref:DUF2510 domain-containing protein n=1 Tax=Streptomyces tateyamensis TaxID=565073 RepID=UPI001FEBB742|nr:DUF2510 domain-containing protein [Streptomyces tateyamensis]